MLRPLPALVLTSVLLSFTARACGQTPIGESELGSFRVVPVVADLENPWAIAFLPGGDMLVTERPGRLRLVRGGVLVAEPIPGVPTVHAQGQGGLLDVALHPDFEQNRTVYLTYSKPVEGGATTALARGRLEGDRLMDVTDLFVADSQGRNHYGSRIAFDGNGHLFLTVGDRQAPPSGDLERHPAQLRSNHQGKVLRLNDDGSVPADNPFVGMGGMRPEIWSYGHRNPQGLFYDRATGNLWADEHGPQGGDELNLVRKGRNYGWPIIGYGVNYGGAPIHVGTARDGLEQPAHYWVPSIATSGLLLYTGDRFPAWKGSLFVGGLAGVQLARLAMNGTRVVSEETLVKGLGRIREIEQGPDGFIYLAIDAAGGPMSVVRLEPAN